MPAVQGAGRFALSKMFCYTASRHHGRRAATSLKALPAKSLTFRPSNVAVCAAHAPAVFTDKDQAALKHAAEDEVVLDEDELEAAIAASRSWSRVVRKPRTRHRHVVVDVCAAKRTGNVQARDEGQLLQQVVGKADVSWAGTRGYRLARKTRWGDLWPTFFQDHAIVVSRREPEVAKR